MARVRAHRSSQARLSGWLTSPTVLPVHSIIVFSLRHHGDRGLSIISLSTPPPPTTTTVATTIEGETIPSILPVEFTWADFALDGWLVVLIIIICCCWRWWGLTCKGRKVSEYEYMWDGWGWLATRVLLCGYHGSDQVSGVAREGVLLYYYISIIMNDDDVVGSFVRRMSAEEEVVLDMWAIIKLLTGHGSSPR